MAKNITFFCIIHFLFPTVKTFSKSVNSWWSYCK